MNNPDKATLQKKLRAASYSAQFRVTVEGLARDGELHPIQRAFTEYHALQCGFCTPGMLLSALTLLQENPNPTDEEIKLGMDSNICRCTGYYNIVDAVRAAAQAMGHRP